MREILFRGRRIDNGEWVYGSYAQQYDCHEILLEHVESEYGFDRYHVDPETVGQYTGLKDKNGKRIFEGDFVRLDKYVKKAFDVYDGVIRYGRGGFYISEFEPLHSLNTIANAEGVLRGEVIGNIHDNPELLVK